MILFHDSSLMLLLETMSSIRMPLLVGHASSKSFFLDSWEGVSLEKFLYTIPKHSVQLLFLSKFNALFCISLVRHLLYFCPSYLYVVCCVNNCNTFFFSFMYLETTIQVGWVFFSFTALSFMMSLIFSLVRATLSTHLSSDSFSRSQSFFSFLAVDMGILNTIELLM